MHPGERAADWWNSCRGRDLRPCAKCSDWLNVECELRSDRCAGSDCRWDCLIDCTLCASYHMTRAKAARLGRGTSAAGQRRGSESHNLPGDRERDGGMERGSGESKCYMSWLCAGCGHPRPPWLRLGGGQGWSHGPSQPREGRDQGWSSRRERGGPRSRCPREGGP